MDASIIIPTFNKCPYLAKTLQTLVGQKNARFEVVVVDDGSTDDTPLLLKTLQTDYSLRYLSSPVNRGRAKARNMGLMEAKGSIVIFLDDDQVVNKEFVYWHVQSGGPNKIVLGKRWNLVEGADAKLADVRSDERGCYRQDDVIRLIQFFQWPLRGDTPLIWLNFTTTNLSAWREDILKAGGFDEHFAGWGCEDAELGYRMSSADKTYFYQPNAENLHLIHPGSGHHFEEWHNNWSYFSQKHPTRDVKLFLPFVAGRVTFLAYLSAVSRDRGTEMPEMIKEPGPFHAPSDAGVPAGGAADGFEIALAYLSAVRQAPGKEMPEQVFDEDYFRALYDDCVSADDIRRGGEAVLALPPDVKLEAKRDAVFLSRSGPFHSDYLPCEFRGIEKEIIIRSDGQTPLSDIIRAIGESLQSSLAEISRIRERASFLVFRGILRNIRRA